MAVQPDLCSQWQCCQALDASAAASQEVCASRTLPSMILMALTLSSSASANRPDCLLERLLVAVGEAAKLGDSHLIVKGVSTGYRL